MCAMRAPSDLPPASTPPAMDQHVKHGLDAAAAGAAFASFAGVLPVVLACIASTLSIVWLTIQITDWYFKRKAKQP